MADWQPTQQFSIPPRLRLLCIGALEPSWISLTLQLDAEGCMEPALKWVSAASEALAVLRKESFDCLLINDVLLGGTQDTVGNSLTLVRAIRASGCDDPVIVVASTADDETWSAACQLQAWLLLSPSGLESLAVVPMIKRAISHVELARENHRLTMADQRRLIRERNEAGHLLDQQRRIIEELVPPENTSGRAPEPATTAVKQRVPIEPAQLPKQLHDYYQELLRTYVIMGSGSLGTEIEKLATLLETAGLSPRQALQLHLERVKSLVHGLGSKSTRHIMARADLLALELMIHIGEHYYARSCAEQIA